MVDGLDDRTVSRLKEIPAVQTVLRHWQAQDVSASPWSQRAVREVLGEVRREVMQDGVVPSLNVILSRTEARVKVLSRPHLRPVINATGVIIHTNLGRAPLPPAMMEHLAAISTQYSTLEYRLDAGERGSRHEHVEHVLADLVGAEAAMVVNNNAAAVLLALSTAASAREVVVSRGELVEIGGSFRIPDVMALSGARLVEVGATNKTHLSDYERAINENTALLLKVHQSNFRQMGFVKSVASEELVNLGHSRHIPVMEDLGSGVLLPLQVEEYREPRVQDVVSAGVDITTFSGDKLLGGPQAGLIVGRLEWIQRMKKHPLARAVRVDKMTLAVLELVLRWYVENRGEELPLWRMIALTADEISLRAHALRDRLGSYVPAITLDIESDWSEIGGGSMPGTRLRTAVLSCVTSPERLIRVERALREGEVPVIARISHGRLLIDMRTVLPEQDHILGEMLEVAFRAAVMDG